MEVAEKNYEQEKEALSKKKSELIGILRSSYHYKQKSEFPVNLEIMRPIDEQYMRTPFYGILRMTVYLRSKGYHVDYKRVERLMNIMGLEAIYPKKRLFIPNNSQRVYPYLLKHLKISHLDHVWCSDVTYI